ncbi:MAG: GTPase ObgE [Acidobacteriota bacterium]
MFVDEADIHVIAGHGGRGCVSFRREKFVPRGGPDGGNGGAGGSVWLVADPHRNTLVHFQFNPEHAAGRGRHGEGAKRTGHSGRDLEVPVPVGTVVFEIDPERPDVRTPIADLTRAGQKVLVARGGRGGLGNAHFVTSTNRAPRKAQPGEPGEDKRLHLELKLLADAGLVGYPNAGKSTLISRISAAHPKIADYPFTTLTPHLGVVSLSDERSFVVADVPGLIEGAHEGHGLGDRFLRHIERTKVLVHLVDVSSASGRDPVDDLETIRRELKLYDPAVLDKPQLVVATKIDALDDPARLEALAARAKKLKQPFLAISAVTGQGVPALLEAMWARIAEARAQERTDDENLSSPPDLSDPSALPDMPTLGNPEPRNPSYNPALIPLVTKKSRGRRK